MIHSKKILILIILTALLLTTVVMTLSSGARLQMKQNKLLEQADQYLMDKVYVSAIPLLQEAGGFKAERTSEAQKKLVDCYIGIDDNFAANKQMEIMIEKKIADESIYMRLADSYFSTSKFKAGIGILEDGIEITKSDELIKMYDENYSRYLEYYTPYELIGENYSNMLFAKNDGKYGYLNPENGISIKFVFDKVTDFDGDKAIAIDGGQAVTINKKGQRLSLCKESIEDIMPLSNGVGAIKHNGMWYYVNTNFERIQTPFEYIGKETSGYRAIKQDGKWYIHDKNRKPVTQAFNEIKVDGNGNAVGLQRAFVKQGDRYILINIEGIQIGKDNYEDAYPFIDGAAAVKIEGKWKFINTDGNIVIDGKFDNAKSFGCDLAPVQIDGKWGYIDTKGILRIDAKYDDVTPLRDGSGAVQTENIWKVIQLKRYKK